MKRFDFQNLRKYRQRRYERLECSTFLIIEERPEKYFTEKEWWQFLQDNSRVSIYIESDLPIPEDLENRIIKANRKIKQYLGS